MVYITDYQKKPAFIGFLTNQNRVESPTEDLSENESVSVDLNLADTLLLDSKSFPVETRFRKNMSISDYVKMNLKHLKENGVIINDTSSLINYFLRYKELPSSIVEATNNIISEFGQDLLIILSFYNDSINEFPVITVRLMDYPEDTEDKLGKIKTKFYSKMDKGYQYFHITTDYEPI